MKTRKQPLHLCFFGTYDRTYTSNMLTLQGLRSQGVRVTEVNAHIKVTTLNKPSEMGWWPLVKRVLRKYRILTETLKNWSVFSQVDAIYVGYPGHFDVLLAVLLGKIFRTKVIFNPLLIFYIGFVEEQKILTRDSLLAKMLKWGESLIYRSVDLVIADTPFQEKLLREEFSVDPKKMCSVPIGADDAVYGYTPFTNTTGPKLHVVYYGLYSPIHGVEHIIEAAEQLRANKDIHFSMVGNGQSFQANYDRAQKLKLKNITFYHNVPESEHIPLLQAGDVFLGFLAKHPTIDRVIPNKVYQGLSLGKVVVTADSPVIRTVFTDGKDMMFVQQADTQSLVKVLTDLSAHPRKRKAIAETGYQLYIKQFSSSAVGKLIVQNIKKIL